MGAWFCSGSVSEKDHRARRTEKRKGKKGREEGREEKIRKSSKPHSFLSKQSQIASTWMSRGGLQRVWDTGTRQGCWCPAPPGCCSSCSCASRGLRVLLRCGAGEQFGWRRRMLQRGAQLWRAQSRSQPGWCRATSATGRGQLLAGYTSSGSSNLL